MNRLFEWPNDGERHYEDTPNPADNPAACGLDIVAQMEDPNSCYDFEDAIVWRDIATGRLFIGFDSGCSCPIPYERVKGLGDLTPVESVEQVRALVDESDDPRPKYGEPRWPQRCREAFYESVATALRGGGDGAV